MNIFLNRHHSDLYWSLALLLEKRLGWKIFIPAGMEWFDKGYFLMHMHPRKREPFRFMAKWFLVDDLFGNKTKQTIKGCEDYPLVNPLTFQEFLDTPIDIIMATNRENEEPFYRLKEFKPKAKFIRQTGNPLDTVNKERYPNCMYSDKLAYDKSDVPNKILYHQEFDLNIFNYAPPTNTKNIYAFMHHLEEFEDECEMWRQHQRIFPDYNFREFGKGNDDGYIYSKRAMADKMREASFVWEIKNCNGYGHVLHNSMAVGRPMIIRRSDITGRIFEPLFDETTCVFTDQMERVWKYQDLGELTKLSEACHKRFQEVVNFDSEYNTVIKPFLERLI